MKIPAILILPGFFIAACVAEPHAGTPAPAATPSQIPGLSSGSVDFDESLREKISGIIAECGKIKPGMPREQVEKVFTMDGGLQDFLNARYVYKRCPVVKMNIKFAPLHPAKDGNESVQPTDVVTEVSKPYLEPEFID